MGTAPLPPICLRVSAWEAGLCRDKRRRQGLAPGTTPTVSSVAAMRATGTSNLEGHPADPDVYRAASQEVGHNARPCSYQGIVKTYKFMHHGRNHLPMIFSITGAVQLEMPLRRRQVSCYTAGLDEETGLAPVTW